MGKVLKWIGIGLGALIVGGVIFGLIVHQPLPEGTKGAEAEAMARQIEQAIDKTAWDSTAYVQWTFAGVHHYFWDKKNNRVEVSWGKNSVLLDLDTQEGKAWSKDEEAEGKKKDKLLKKAWAFFCNDSFWLNAPAKVFDPGTERSIVTLKDGRKGLMISYSSGGVTPGDSYVWVLDESGRPASWKMWVSVLPIGGLEAQWSDWKQLSTGAWIAQSHPSKIYTLKITNLKGGNSLELFDRSENPFDLLAKM